LERVKTHFDSAAAADKYLHGLTKTNIDRQEQRSLRKLLGGFAPGGRILDMPCGTGRLVPLLADMGFVVTGADTSEFMLEKARQYVKEDGCDMAADRFVAANAFGTDFKDEEFDLVLCNRLLHHFSDSSSRQQILKELARISRGPIVVSFFWSLSWGALTFRVQHFVKRKKPIDRIPERLSDIRKDAQAAGLTSRRILPMLPLISKQCYLVLDKAQAR
jgi:SAM-dependent methyltransferase